MDSAISRESSLAVYRPVEAPTGVDVSELRQPLGFQTKKVPQYPPTALSQASQHRPRYKSGLHIVEKIDFWSRGGPPKPRLLSVFDRLLLASDRPRRPRDRGSTLQAIPPSLA